MPSKKKKYNARFPPARIKKIMQTDEDVGKVAAAVPVIISRALELFIESLILKSNETTQARNARTLSTAHIKHIILSEKKFDFLRDLVANVADVQPAEEEEPDSPQQTSTSADGGPEPAHPPPPPAVGRAARAPRATHRAAQQQLTPPSASASAPASGMKTEEGAEGKPAKRPRGRPRKVRPDDQQLPPKKRGRKVYTQPVGGASDDSTTEDAESSGSGVEAADRDNRLAIATDYSIKSRSETVSAPSSDSMYGPSSSGVARGGADSTTATGSRLANDSSASGHDSEATEEDEEEEDDEDEEEDEGDQEEGQHPPKTKSTMELAPANLGHAELRYDALSKQDGALGVSATVASSGAPPYPGCLMYRGLPPPPRLQMHGAYAPPGHMPVPAGNCSPMIPPPPLYRHGMPQSLPSYPVPMSFYGTYPSPPDGASAQTSAATTTNTTRGHTDS